MGATVGRALIRGSLVRIASSVVSLSVGFFMMPFLVRTLGSYRYGLWVAASSVIANFYLLDFGFSAAVMRNVAVGLAGADDDRVNRTVNAALRIYLVLGGAIASASVVVAALAGQFVAAPTALGDVRLVLLLTGLNLGLGFPFKAFSGIAQAQLRYDLLAGSQAVLAVGNALLTVWLLRLGHGIVTLALLAFVFGQVGNLLFYLTCKRAFPGLRLDWGSIDRQEARQLSKYSIWAFGIQLSNQLRFKVDALVIGAVFSASEVTPYYIGVRLVEYVTGILWQATNMTTPVLTKFHATGDHAGMVDAVEIIWRLHVLLAIFAGGMINAFARPFLTTWMGPDYGQSVLVARILGVAFLVDYISSPYISVLYARGHLRPLATASLLEGVSNLAISVLLAHRIGIVGVAVGTLVPMLVFRLTVVVPTAAREIAYPVGRLIRAVVVPLAGSGLLVWGLLSGVGPRISSNYPSIALWAVGATGFYWLVAANLLLRPEEQRRLFESAPRTAQFALRPFLLRRQAVGVGR